MARSQSCIKIDTGKVGMTGLDMPSPGPGQALVRTRLSTVCGSDIHMVDEIPELPAGTPMGHEAVGEVVDAGDGVTSFRQGERVVASCLFGCGVCPRCQDGMLQVCERYTPMNLLFGAQGEYFLVQNAELTMAKVPDALDDEAVLFATDIMSTAFGAIEAAALRYGDSVAIFAQGPVGLCATVAARARGAGLIVAVERIPARVAMAKRLGADVVLAPEDAVGRILALTGGKGVDVAVEALGQQTTLESAARVTRFGGAVSSVGVYSLQPTVALPTDGTFLHRRFVTTLCPSGADRLRRMMDVVRYGKVDLTPLFTHHMKLADTPAAYDLFRSRRDGVIKIALRP